MFKKSLSLILALIVAFCMTVPAFAADADALTDAQAVAAAEAGIAAIVADEDADVEVSDDLADKIINDANTPEKIARSIAKFVFVEKSKVGELSDAIIADSKYSVTVSADGKDTVYVAIDTVAHPEIYDARIFLSVCDKLVAKCDEVASLKGIDTSSDNYDPMSYYHIAGELALHMILTALSKDSVSWNPISAWIYERAGIADLNVDEDRVPAVLLQAFGDAVVKLISFVISIIG